MGRWRQWQEAKQQAGREEAAKQEDLKFKQRVGNLQFARLLAKAVLAE